ncbi:GAF domain-containing protein [Fragilariopsis cylindrus CCMP1102]|uniref:GAF domain-containing protein n=1 Tax=Fragilariopsis cylindrus CCMP1102 TaxID=635003 RepID=A0A1E7EU24_9STRA|nr:GAF domain-containing protein [Fragilariopsis cylindrus CCMP1102]|eukprot:OEU09347.1 GAF domain-containing protein [Fragilariopsis cylindrus CCMP1102]
MTGLVVISRRITSTIFLPKSPLVLLRPPNNMIVGQAQKKREISSATQAIATTTNRTTCTRRSFVLSSSPSPSPSTIITASPRNWQNRNRKRHRRWNTTTTTTTTTKNQKLSSSSSPPPLEAVAVAVVVEVIQPPTTEQLRIVAFRAGIPMIGFGIMDNVVMITAGEAIDSTFGVTLGISTMAAAGFGQCCSDVAGITSGGIVDATVSKLNLKNHGLTQLQLDLKKTRLYSTFGACVGVVTGCLLGMTVLLFMDTDRADRAKRSKELKSIFESVMNDGHKLVGAERATLFMVDDTTKELWSQVATGIKTNSSNSNTGIVGHSVTTKQIVNVPNAYDDTRFNSKVDTITGFKTISVIVVPIFDDNNKDKKVIGAIQMLNKKIENSCEDDPDCTTCIRHSSNTNSTTTTTIVPFNECDEKILKVLASHVASFIRVVDS